MAARSPDVLSRRSDHQPGSSDPRSWRRKLSDPRVALFGSALALELIALALWPTLYLLDSSAAPSAFGEMLRRRLPAIDFIAEVSKGAIDWLFPGALWSWEQLVTFFFHSLIVAFVAYAAAAWALVRWEAAGEGSRSRWGLRSLLAPLVIVQLTLLVTPATLTTDIFNYALYGDMPALFGANPFVRSPAEFPESALYYLIPLYWHDTPSVYGPLWIALSAGIASVFQSHPLIDELLAYRAVANVGHLANTVLIWLIATRLRPSTAPSAAFAYGFNPLALLEFSLNGHNDVLMLTFILSSVVFGLSRRPRLAAVALGCSIAAKYTTVLIAPLFLVWFATLDRKSGAALSTPLRAAMSRRGLGELGIGAGISGAVVIGWFLPWIQGLDTLGPVLYWVTGPRLQNYWPEPSLISLTAWTAGALGATYESVWDPLLWAFKQVARIVLVGWIGWELARVGTASGVLGGSVRVWLVFLILVNTWIMPWYYTWTLGLAAALGWQSILVRICAGLTLTAPLVMYGRQLGFAPVGEWAGITLALPLILVAATTGLGRLRREVRAPGRAEGAEARPVATPSP